MYTNLQIKPFVYEFGYTDASSFLGNAYPLYTIRLKVKRNSRYYTQRITLVLAFLSLSVLSSFAVAWDESSDRLSIDFTVLLTAVAFQYVITSSLPVLPFLTIIDWYILCTMAFIILIIFMHSFLIELIQMMEGDESAEDIDRYLFWTSLIVWIVLQFGFAGYSQYISRKEMRKLTMNKQQLDQYIKKKQNDGVMNQIATFRDEDLKQIEAGQWCSGVAE